MELRSDFGQFGRSARGDSSHRTSARHLRADRGPRCRDSAQPTRHLAQTNLSKSAVSRLLGKNQGKPACERTLSFQESVNFWNKGLPRRAICSRRARSLLTARAADPSLVSTGRAEERCRFSIPAYASPRGFRNAIRKTDFILIHCGKCSPKTRVKTVGLLETFPPGEPVSRANESATCAKIKVSLKIQVLRSSTISVEQSEESRSRIPHAGRARWGSRRSERVHELR